MLEDCFLLLRDATYHTYHTKVTINGLYKLVHELSIAAKMYDLE